MRSWMIAFISAIALFWLLPKDWFSIQQQLLFLLIAIAGWVATTMKLLPRLPPQIPQFLVFAIIGFVVVQQQHQMLRKNQHQLPPHNQTIRITGVIVNSAVKYQNFVSFRVKLDSLNSHLLQRFWKPSVQLNWYFSKKPLSKIPQRGEQWQFFVRLKPLHGLRNPEASDYERWGWSKRIIARGYVVNKKPQSQIKQAHELFKTWRDKISQSLSTAMPRHADLAASLIIGDKSALSMAIKENLQKAGLAHLLAISGLHIGMVAVLAFLLFGWLWRQSAKLCGYIPAVDVAAVFSVLIATIYALLSGWAIPAQRALLMLLIVSLNHLLRLHWRLLDVLLLALSILLALNPISILDSSGWLSFGAVFIIAGLLSTEKTHQQSDFTHWLRLKNWIVFSVRLWLFLIPITMIIIGKVALLGFVANVLAIPLMNFLIMPVLLLGAFAVLFSSSLASVLFGLSDYLLTPITTIGDILSISGIEVSDPVGNGTVLLILSFLWILPRAIIPFKPTVLLSIMVLILMSSGIQKPRLGARLIVFDVGQGLAVLWEEFSENETPHRIMIDTGFGNRQYKIARNSWLPYFKSKKIDHIEALFVSHNDADHAGGLSLFEDEIGVDTVY